MRAVLRRLLARFGRAEQTPHRPARGRVDHVIIIDGTMSSLAPGQETHAGLAYKLIREAGPGGTVSLVYEAGVQWQTWRHTIDIIEGRGDRIFLFG